MGVLRPGDVDGDIQLLLDAPLPCTARALDDATLLSLSASDFDHLLCTSPPITRRWLSSVAQRLAASQMRLRTLAARSPSRLRHLLLDEAVDDEVSVRRLDSRRARAVRLRPCAASLGGRRRRPARQVRELRDDLARQGVGGHPMTTDVVTRALATSAHRLTEITEEGATAT